MSKTSPLGSRTAVFALVLSALPAHAAPNPAECMEQTNCREMLRSAMEQAKSDPAAALRQFKALYEMFSDPCLLYNVARMQHKLGQPQPAEESYLRYMERCTSAAADQRERAAGYLVQVRKELASKALVPPSAPPAPPGPSSPLAASPPSPAPAPEGRAPADLRTLPVPIERPVPLYRRVWFWAAVGGAAAATLGLGVGLGVRSSAATPDGTSIAPQVPAEAVILSPTF